MASKQGAISAPVPVKGRGNGVGQAPEAASRVEMTSRGSVVAGSSIGVEGAASTWFRGLLLRRRCDSCGTRIRILGEGDDKVFMRCPECLREYVFFHRHE
ncbi:MAG: hypothetical protein P4L43_02485 [Syntrophobacteraceae bacterium]|nr:hypothetical protein [Syntrophobacteraceae bacterium]